MKIFELSYLSQVEEGRTIQVYGSRARARARARSRFDAFRVDGGVVTPDAETFTRARFRQDVRGDQDQADAYSDSFAGGRFIGD